MISKFFFNFSNFCIIICFLNAWCFSLYFSNFSIVICLFNKTTCIRNFFSNSALSAHTQFLKQICQNQYYLLQHLINHIHFFSNIIFYYITQFTQISRTGANLSISSLSTSVFKLARFDFNAKLEVSACEIFLTSTFVA